LSRKIKEMGRKVYAVVIGGSLASDRHLMLILLLEDTFPNSFSTSVFSIVCSIFGLNIDIRFQNFK
jgi:hypothetical protein